MGHAGGWRGQERGGREAAAISTHFVIIFILKNIRKQYIIYHINYIILYHITRCVVKDT